MDKKHILWMVSVLLAMSAGIAVSIFFLYADVTDGTESQLEVVQSVENVEQKADDSAGKNVEAQTQTEQSQIKQFEVKNSSTGKMNIFSQNQDMSLSLTDEKGVESWRKSFDKPICGAVSTIDFYKNGKLQFLFGAGSRLYLIDRLGNFVKDFSVNLPKDIAVGPDVYDFSKKRRYNLLVLHTDGTIEMYNIKGEKPKKWKGIVPQSQVSVLPERLTLGTRDFWVVRTAENTQIYTFYGGTPLDLGVEISSDSKVSKIDNSNIEIVDKSGKKLKVKI